MLAILLIVFEATPKTFRKIIAKTKGYFIVLIGSVVVLALLFAPLVVIENKNYNFFSIFQSFASARWLLIAIVVLILIANIFSIFSRKKEELLSGTCLTLLVASALLILLKTFTNNEGNYGWGLVIAVILLSLIAFTSLILSAKGKEFSVYDIAEDGILIAAAFVLNFIKVPLGSTGGSANFQMLPLFIIALRHGPTQGFICGGIIYGLLTCLTDGYGIIYYPFDYMIGFGSVIVMGFFRQFILNEKINNYNLKGILFIIISGFISTVVRLIGGCISSILYYGASLGYALLYNLPYIGISGAIGIIAIIAMYGPLIKINKRFNKE